MTSGIEPSARWRVFDQPNLYLPIVLTLICSAAAGYCWQKYIFHKNWNNINI